MYEYKYEPSDFSEYLFLSEDLTDYYMAVDDYYADKTINKKLAAHTKLEALHYTIKHRELDSHFDKNLAEEMRDYIWSLIDD